MTPEELRDYCRKCIREGARRAVLQLHRKTAPMGERVRLAKTAGPLGEIYNVQAEKTGGWSVVGAFKPKDVLDWLRAKDPTLFGDALECEGCGRALEVDREPRRCLVCIARGAKPGDPPPVVRF